jgi:hypothetical protein
VVEAAAAEVAPGTTNTDDEALSVGEVLRIAFRDYRKRTVMIRAHLIIESPLGIGLCGMVFAASTNVAVIVVAGFRSPTFPIISSTVSHLPG